MAKITKGRKSVKYYEEFPGNVQRPCKQFTEELKKIRKTMKYIKKDTCEVILHYIPIVSRAGTDIEAALQKLNGLDDKYVALVVLHHTFDKESVVPDSSRAVNRDRDRTITVDCLFHEDEGLLKCQKNDDAIQQVAKWLWQVKHKGKPAKDAVPDAEGNGEKVNREKPKHQGKQTKDSNKDKSNGKMNSNKDKSNGKMIPDAAANTPGGGDGDKDNGENSKHQGKPAKDSNKDKSNGKTIPDAAGNTPGGGDGEKDNGENSKHQGKQTKAEDEEESEEIPDAVGNTQGGGDGGKSESLESCL